MFRKKLVIILFACSLIFGCSNPVHTDTNKNTQETRQMLQVATDLPGMLKEGPGNYAGDNYQKETFQKEVLSQFSKDLSGQDVYNRLVYYFAEGYTKEIDTMNNVDPTYSLKDNRPTGNTPDSTNNQSTKKVHVQILLDASGSMAAKVEGKSKMELAKEAVNHFASNLGEGTEVSLRVYGHKGSGSAKDKQLSCSSTEVIYPNSAYDAAKFKNSLATVQPTGWTPLGKAISDAKNDLQQTDSPDSVNVVYVVSDGLESCGGDPVKAAQDIHQSNVQTVVNIIGFDIKSSERQALEKISQAGGGKYIDVKTADDLKRELQTANTRLWLDWYSWDMNNRGFLLKQWGEKYSVVGKSYSSGLQKILREHDREISSLLYLNSQGIVKGKAFSEASDLIAKRFKMISNKITDTQTKKNTQLKDLRELLEQKVKDEADDMKNKYKN